MAEILFTTCRQWPAFSASDSFLADALKQLGHSVRPVPWNDPAVDQFRQCGLVLLRATWDYDGRIAEFLKWLAAIEGSVRLQNAANLVRWNMHKGYIAELRSKGLNTPISILLDRDERPEDIYERHGWTYAVIKPVHGADGKMVERVPRAMLADWAATVRERRPDDSWVVQEFIPEIQTEGELSLVFLNGVYSHAIRKVPKAGEFRTNNANIASVSRVESLDPRVIEQAGEFLHALAEVPLYARVDGVWTASGFRLMELELIEPTLYFEYAPEKAVDFARAIHARVDGNR